MKMARRPMPGVNQADAKATLRIYTSYLYIKRCVIQWAIGQTPAVQPAISQ
jgi:hypothetical protein